MVSWLIPCLINPILITFDINLTQDKKMKKSSLLLLVALPLTAFLTGCVVAVGGDKGDYGYSYDFEDKEQENRHQLSKLQLGMPLVMVRDMMGIPDFNEVYNKNDEIIQVLFYRTHRSKKDGITTKDECTPLIFKENKLVAWGENAYKQL